MTDNELKRLIVTFANYSKQVTELEKIRKQISTEILEEMENRKTMDFEGKKIITEKLYETPDRQKLKDLLGNNYNDYCNVSYSKYVNSASAKKFTC